MNLNPSCLNTSFWMVSFETAAGTWNIMIIFFLRCAVLTSKFLLKSVFSVSTNFLDSVSFSHSIFVPLRILHILLIPSWSFTVFVICFLISSALCSFVICMMVVEIAALTAWAYMAGVFDFASVRCAGVLAGPSFVIDTSSFVE